MGLDGKSEVPLYGHEKLWDQPGKWAPEIPSSFDCLPRKSFKTDVRSVQSGQQSSVGQDMRRSGDKSRKTRDFNSVTAVSWTINTKQAYCDCCRISPLCRRNLNKFNNFCLICRIFCGLVPQFFSTKMSGKCWHIHIIRADVVLQR